MALHIDNINGSGIPMVDKAAFYAACKPGMPIFCQGHYPISLGIEKFTGSPFSHIATLFYLHAVDRWAVIEATKDHGVHVGHLDYYTDQYEGDLVLAATPRSQRRGLHGTAPGAVRSGRRRLRHRARDLDGGKQVIPSSDPNWPQGVLLLRTL